ncbi:hypothetical protein [cyanobacterium endosymbiont of Epithemia turgida]|uniref:hypothetical protein n=1 Tax=cyanobacterium endosymbiont of Epithemia turgida TaxID=718217 RepID=UPI0038CD8343
MASKAERGRVPCPRKFKSTLLLRLGNSCRYCFKRKVIPWMSIMGYPTFTVRKNL